MTRRLSTDAKIVLQRAGYTVERKLHKLIVTNPTTPYTEIAVKKGTVDNEQVKELLRRAGCDEFGYKRRNETK